MERIKCTKRCCRGWCCTTFMKTLYLMFIYVIGFGILWFNHCKILAGWEAVTFVPLLVLWVIACYCNCSKSWFYWVYLGFTLLTCFLISIVFYLALFDVELVFFLYPFCKKNPELEALLKGSLSSSSGSPSHTSGADYGVSEALWWFK